MANEYVPEWLSGQDTFEHIARARPNGTEQERQLILHSAVLDGRIRVRLRGLTRTEQIYEDRGITLDAAGDWLRSNFFRLDTNNVNWREALERMQFMRTDVLKCFPLSKLSRQNLSEPQCRLLAAQYIEGERSAGRYPTQSGFLATNNGRASRSRLEKAYNHAATATGVEVARGRRKNPPKAGSD